jgi:hypothetical protein
MIAIDAMGTPTEIARQAVAKEQIYVCVSRPLRERGFSVCWMNALKPFASNLNNLMSRRDNGVYGMVKLKLSVASDA